MCAFCFLLHLQLNWIHQWLIFAQIMTFFLTDLNPQWDFNQNVHTQLMNHLSGYQPSTNITFIWPFFCEIYPLTNNFLLTDLLIATIDLLYCSHHLVKQLKWDILIQVQQNISVSWKLCHSPGLYCEKIIYIWRHWATKLHVSQQYVSRSLIITLASVISSLLWQKYSHSHQVVWLWLLVSRITDMNNK